jgi:hypothetical protein
MEDLIEDELRGVLADWNAGKPIRTIVLGHRVRVDGTNDYGLPREVRNEIRQRLALSYVFELIAAGLKLGMPFTWGRFFELCLDQRTTLAIDRFTKQEIEAAESLAWKALLRGWNRAITGFPDVQYVSISKSAARRIA